MKLIKQTIIDKNYPYRYIDKVYEVQKIVIDKILEPVHYKVKHQISNQIIK